MSQYQERYCEVIIKEDLAKDIMLMNSSRSRLENGIRLKACSAFAQDTTLTDIDSMSKV